jgi:amino acid adenylation domain-containing protein
MPSEPPGAWGAATPLPPPPRTVPPRQQRDLCPLSFDQERLWFIQQLDLASPVYNIYAANRFRGALDVAALRAALAEVVRRHEVLRTSFPVRGGRPLQRIAPRLTVPLPLIDLRALAAGAREAEALRLAERTVRAPFQLDSAPLFRLLLVQTGDDDFIRPMAIHHMITDRLAFFVFESELARLYDAAHAGRTDLGRVLPEPPLQFADFAVWQRAALTGEVLARHLDYWRERLAGLPGLLPLPTDRPRPALQTPWGERLRFWIDAPATAALHTLARASGVTLFVAGLALWKALLARLTGEERVSVGTPMTYREALETSGALGFYLNQLVLATDLAGDPPVRELVARVRATALGAYAHQDLPFGQLVEALRPQRDLSYIPFIQVIFLLLDPPAVAPLAAPLAAEPYWVDARRTQFDITLALFEQGDGLFGMFEYNTDLFDRVTAERMKEAFLALFGAAVARPELRLGDLPLLAPAQRHQLLHEWAEADFAPRRAAAGEAVLPVHRLVRRQAAALAGEALAGLEARAGRAAVAGRLTYGELQERVDRLARRLRLEGVGAAAGQPGATARVGAGAEAGAGAEEGTGAEAGGEVGAGAGGRGATGRGAEQVVAVALERSPRLVVALLAVLEAGGVYLPLDLSHPQERLNQILADSGARLILTGADLPDGILPAAAGRRLLRLDGEGSPGEGATSDAAPDGGLPAGAGGEDGEELDRLAYILYTSGTTGTPKGVEVTHRALAAFLAAMAELHPLAAGDSWMAITTPAFDISLAEMLLPLTRGARVLLASREVAGDPVVLARALAEHRATVLQATPAGWRQLLDAGWRGQAGLRLLCGGEALPGDLAARLLPAGAALWNQYGPTEATVWATTGRVAATAGTVGAGGAADAGSGPVPLGRPLAGTRVHVLDRWLRPAPAGVTGELYLGGAGVARGYRGRPELTAERFVPDPFAAGGARLYRTGDRARHRADGALEFLGRTDRQLKLRGFRVEPAEVEAHLARHPAVAAAAVLPRDEPGGAVLGAYLVARPGTAPDELSSARLRLYLQDRLPAYMMPAFYLTLAAFPLTPSGKLDRQALARAGAEAAGPAVRYVAPRGPLEEWLAATCAELLGRERVGMADNFFDLGGHSLLGTQLLARLADEWGTEIRLQTLFQIQTLRDLADRILEDEISRATAADLAAVLGAPEGPG